MAADGLQQLPDGGLPYLRRPSFIKVFSRIHNMEELRLPPEFDVIHGPTLPLECRLVMPNGVGWTVRLLRLGNDTQFYTGWREFVGDVLFKHGDFLTFTLVDVGTFHVKRYDVRTGVPPLTDGEDFAYDAGDDVPSADVETTDDYQPSETDADSSDDSGYEDDHDALDLDGRPTFTVTITQTHIQRTLDIPYGFWHRHIRMGALQAPVYFLTEDNTSMLTLMHSESKIWVRKGWKRFRSAKEIVVGDRCHFTLVNPDEVTFYVVVEKAVWCRVC